MKAYTKGPVEVIRNDTSLFIVGANDGRFGRPTICDMPVMRDGEPCRNALDDADLIAEAFNVYSETGLTPRQLADRIEHLESMIRHSQE